MKTHSAMRRCERAKAAAGSSNTRNPPLASQPECGPATWAALLKQEAQRREAALLRQAALRVGPADRHWQRAQRAAHLLKVGPILGVLGPAALHEGHVLVVRHKCAARVLQDTAGNAHRRHEHYACCSRPVAG